MIRAGRHDIGTYLDLAAVVAGDDTPSVIDDVAARVGAVADAVADANQRAAYKAWIRARFGPVLESLGLPGRADRPRRRAGPPRHAAHAARRHG